METLIYDSISVTYVIAAVWFLLILGININKDD